MTHESFNPQEEPINSNDDRIILSTDQYRSFLELCSEPIVVCCEYIITYINPACVEMIGAVDKRDIIGKSIFSFLLPEYIQATKVLINELLQSGKPSELIEKKWLRLDGCCITVEVRAIPIIYGNKPAVMLLCTDITKRRDAEEALAESEQRLFSILKLSPEAIVIHHNDIIYYVNDALVKIFRASNAKQFIGRPIYDFVHPDYHKVSRERTASLTKTKKDLDFIVLKMIRMDGELIDLEVSSSEIHSNLGKGHIQTVLRDISERVKHEEALRESSIAYQKLIKFLPEPIIISDNGIIIYTNISYIKLVKAINEEEILGRRIFEFVHPDQHHELFEVIRQVIESDHPTPFQETVLNCSNGDQVTVEISSIKIDSYMGKSVILSVLRDLTERKNAEEMLVKSEKLSVVGQLAAGVAHEIRNPLTALKGFTQLLHRDLGSKYHYLSIMLSELERINYIVNEFMSLSKPQMTAFRIRNIMEILKGVINILEPQAILNNVILLLDDNDMPCFINCDENQLKQVFINIITNAIDAMPQGGNIIIFTLINNDAFLVSIRDQGQGIPEDLIHKIGEPFFTTKDKGTGLGLMICHRIIEAHQGIFQITSIADFGTTVHITLPIALVN